MHALGMIATSNLGPLLPLELPINMNFFHDQHDPPYPQDYSSSGTTYGGIDMPAEEFYQVHTTNLNRPPTVSTITPRKPTSSPPPGRPTPRRSPGPIFLPANIYKLLSDVAIKELKKHNATTRSTPPPKRAVNTHDTDPSPRAATH